jgi:hypothetical protein
MAAPVALISRIALVSLLCASCAQPPGDDPLGPDSVEQKTSALSTCGWGAGDYVRGGYFNDDDIADLASPAGGNIFQYIATGAPSFTFTFTQPTVTNAWGGSNYTWSGDFNGDRRYDFASASAGNLFMKLASGSGFRSETWTVPNIWGASGYTWVGKFNSDNNDDIATANAGTINLFASTGSGFQLIKSVGPNNWGGSNYTWAADFNGDGLTDIGSASGNNMFMKLASDSGQFDSQTWPVFNAWGISSYTFVGDFTGDGKADIASAVGGTVYMKISTGTGFANRIWNVNNAWGDVGQGGVNLRADVNGDGKMDLVSRVSINSPSVLVKLANAAGDGFIDQTWSVDPFAPWGNVTWFGDFTGDRKIDIMTINTSTCQGKLYVSTGSGFVAHPF